MPGGARVVVVEQPRRSEAVLPSPAQCSSSSRTDRGPVSSLGVSFGPCRVQVEPDRVKTQAAPALVVVGRSRRAEPCFHLSTTRRCSRTVRRRPRRRPSVSVSCYVPSRPRSGEHPGRACGVVVAVAADQSCVPVSRKLDAHAKTRTAADLVVRGQLWRLRCPTRARAGEHPGGADALVELVVTHLADQGSVPVGRERDECSPKVPGCLPTSFEPCCVHVDPVRTNTQTAPGDPKISARAVVGSTDKEPSPIGRQGDARTQSFPRADGAGFFWSQFRTPAAGTGRP